jgi:serine/threonine protein kinase
MIAYTRIADPDGYLPYDIPKDVLDETLAMERISAAPGGPHPNVIRYLGCRVRRARITAILLERHDETLLECLNSDPERFARLDADAIMAGLESALSFIHGLGLAHNDVSPYNVMLGKQGEAVLIDFGSCGPWGKLLQSAGTVGFCDGFTRFSKRENDEYSVRKVREWMEEEQKKAAAASVAASAVSTD